MNAANQALQAMLGDAQSVASSRLGSLNAIMNLVKTSAVRDALFLSNDDPGAISDMLEDIDRLIDEGLDALEQVFESAA